MLPYLPDHLWEYIFSLSNISCHTCNKKIINEKDLFKKLGPFYYCCNSCYLYI